MNNIIERLYNYLPGGSFALLRTVIAMPKVPILIEMQEFVVHLILFVGIRDHALNVFVQSFFYLPIRFKILCNGTFQRVKT
jgi:hypothetical protein